MSAEAENDAREADDGGSASLVRKKSKVKKSETLWLMSFSDMSLILMSFFILQLSYSTPDKRKYDNLSSAINETQQQQPQENLKSIESKLDQVVKEQSLDKSIDVTSSMQGLAIEFRDGVLFETGSSAPKAATEAVVSKVLAVIAKTPGNYKIVIEGHTDDVKIATPKAGAKQKQFTSNWELAASRGISLLEGFKKRGVAETRLSVLAYAQTKPKIAPEGLKGEALTKARAANRRVVIRIE